MDRRLVAAVTVGLIIVVLSPSAIAGWVASHPGSSDDQDDDFVSFGSGWSSHETTGGSSLWTAPPQPGRAVFVMVHGIRQPRADLRELSNNLREKGYGIVLPQLPFANESATYGGGAREAKVVTSAVEWSRQFGSPVVLMGFSTGGFSSLVAVADGLRVDAVITDSAFIDARETFTDIAAQQTPLPTVAFAGMGLAFQLFSNGGELTSLRKDAFNDPPPTFVIHCINDDYVDVENASLVADALNGEAWLAPGDGHGGAWYENSVEYERRVTAFLEAAIR